MSTVNRFSYLAFLIVATCLALNPLLSRAQTTPHPPPQKAVEQSKKAAKTLDAALANLDQRIPKALLTKAVAVAVLPDVKKISLLIEGAGTGRGVVARRLANGTWSPPVYIRLAAVSIGPQIRSGKFDVIMLFMNERSANWLLHDGPVNFDQAKAPVAGPVGEIKSEEKEVVPVADVFSYIYDEGRLQGKDLKNVFKNLAFTFDNDLNKATYSIKAGVILAAPDATKIPNVPTEVMVFSETVARYFLPD
jgi:lipid-binding SYLF domain-containing protein